MLRRTLALAALLTLPTACARTLTQSPAARTARHLDAVRRSPPEAMAFLRAMPKGGDLHNHLAGAVYAEHFVQWGVEDGMCLRHDAAAIVEPPCDTARGDVPLADALRTDPTRARALIDAWSMRNFDASRSSGHDHFFATFDGFDARASRYGDMLAEVVSRLARQHTYYVEVMQSLGTAAAMRTGHDAGWTPDLAEMERRLPPERFADVVRAARQRLDDEEARVRTLLRCGQADEDPGCRVTVRHLVTMYRTVAPEELFAHTVAAVEVARADPRVVGINLVAPEDDPVSLRDYRLHMRIVDRLTAHGTRVNVSLHAGELTPSLVPPEDAGFHIREAVTVAGARRIGHGTDMAFEDDASDTLARMAREGIAVEHCLTSADVILGVRGLDHPFALYRSAGVPQVLCTDDEGVSRTDLSREFHRALTTWNLSWRDLKGLARNALTYSFLAGASLWGAPVCAADVPGSAHPSPACAALLAASDRAREQWRLESDLARFEAQW